ncbi:lysozyme [Pseudomonas sp. AFG_SD02_1510_Pfu_092]|uniref:glycoside hydrolase family 19 protein n=1 Tax=Pseudomonas sp. AFG_SD02_1510_Pfu_092 TaxID=2259497 RepID=UPI000DEF2CC2|nr:glycoside hydrolase family 19 protein [Pseudomonas sp. AFG_SD02_1510_Pfu_092]RCL28267.1 lysozyme [Pseudomonas sp. AFG_SD02_1510_Pfu_092]
MLTETQLLYILPNARPVAGVFLSALNASLPRWEIDNAKRVAAFIAQVGHESGQFRYLKELGNDHYLARYDTGRLALRLGNTPQADGDGQRYCGRGLIQVTGRNNYLACSRALFGDQRLLAQPQLLEQPRWACESAAWFWHSRGLNALADRGEFNRITRHVNGGLNGLDERLELWARAREVLC